MEVQNTLILAIFMHNNTLNVQKNVTFSKKNLRN